MGLAEVSFGPPPEERSSSTVVETRTRLLSLMSPFKYFVLHYVQIWLRRKIVYIRDQQNGEKHRGYTSIQKDGCKVVMEHGIQQEEMEELKPS